MVVESIANTFLSITKCFWLSDKLGKYSLNKVILDLLKNNIAPTTVCIRNSTALWSVIKFTMGYFVTITYYACTQFSQRVTTRSNPVKHGNKMLKCRESFAIMIRFMFLCALGDFARIQQIYHLTAKRLSVENCTFDHSCIFCERKTQLYEKSLNIQAFFIGQH